MTTLPKIMNRSASTGMLNIQDMYNIATRNYSAWGVEGYEVPKQYCDPLKQIKDKEYEEMRKKGKIQKPKGKVTKRGNFLDDQIKSVNQKIGPWTYYQPYQYVSKAEIEKGKKKLKNASKDSFIDAIFKQKDRAPPGPGKYNLEKTQEERKKEIDVIKKNSASKIKGQKNSSLPNFLDEYEYLGALTPGPGGYNPKLKDQFAFDSLKKLHLNKTKPADWLKKHEELTAKNKKSKFPDVGSYNPVPMDCQTFTKISIDFSDKNKSQTKVKYLGTEPRFIDMKKSKSQIIMDLLKRPGPGEYECRTKWFGKDKKDNKNNKMLDYHKLSQGLTSSIYYQSINKTYK